MNARGIRADLVFAWPSAESAVMGAQGAVNIIHRREISATKEPEGAFGSHRRLRGEVQQSVCGSRARLVDEVIEPRETRYKLIRASRGPSHQARDPPPKKHGNGPQ